MLTPHQKEILDESVSILKKNDRLLIKGSAGVGKTYMVNELIKELINSSIVRPGKFVFCSAPTNKAVAVIKGKVEQTGKIEFITVHSALKMKMYYQKDGTPLFKPSYDDRYPPLQNVGLFIIDEASMLNSELIDYIDEHAFKNRTKVIFIGDNKQLNPVGEEESPVFFSDYPEVELTEIIRQGKGNPIIDLSRDTSLLWTGKPSIVDEDNKIGYLYNQNKSYIIDKLADANGTDKLKYLAWTNKEVDHINFLVRKKIYGIPKKLELGETIVFNSPYKDKYVTNEELKIDTLQVEEITFDVIVESSRLDKSFEAVKHNLTCYIINGKKVDSKWSNDSVIIIHEDSEEDFRILKSKLNSSAKNRQLEWVDYYGFVNLFGDFKYNHALTVHKSQGSTYKKAIVNVKDLNNNKKTKEKKRLFYTAITRAAETLIIYNI